MTLWRLGVLLLVGAAASPACTTLEPVEMPAADVQRMILTEEIPLEGESIRVVTSDGKTHKYRVIAVDMDERLIQGRKDAVSIDDVVAIETREFSVGKTALLAGGSYLVIALIVAAVGPALLL